VVNPTDVRASAPPRLLVLLFVLMAVLVGVDMVSDLGDRTSLAHVALELLVMTIGFAAAGSIALRLRRAARHAQELRAHAAQLAETLRASQEDAAKWRADAADLIDGLSAAIDAQFGRWELTPAEREIALLLMKGLSHKEIAQVRALYRNTVLSGRNDLAAFFLEDLLGPRERVRPVDILVKS